MKFLLPLALLCAPARAMTIVGPIDYQEVRTNLYTFVRDGVLVSAGNKILVDRRDFKRERFGKADVKILSAAGPMVSVYSKASICEKEGRVEGMGCSGYEVVDARDGQGRKVFLENLTTEGSLLQALRTHPYLLKKFKEDQSEGGVYQRFLKASTLAAMRELLERGMESDTGGHLSLRSGKFDNFSLNSYDDETNRLTVRFVLEDSHWMLGEAKVITLVVEPKQEFAQELWAAKYKGEGLFQNRR